ncbi:DUF7144 family membrane protein [Pseudonocardia kunmingensis]|uniref:DUF7144 domain-containing protein n=1 Tax=Pseudonocardia kunmingensis TaxID=630975 RepID=A0A543DWD9_9PSEU|nr:hypothetical protein [Pseudonocardia kunmingensis]TQM13636.1 hypothetical protein FB558_0389 [Pseudonocardia kunmingensis]
MSTSHETASGGSAGYHEPVGRGETSPWVTGLAVFAGSLMIVIGIFHATVGLVALFRNEVYVVGVEYMFAFDVTTWGWIHLVAGVLVLAAGCAVLAGQLWGRIVGIALAVLSMVANFLFVPYYPVWALLIIALDVFVIWALCSFDRDAAAR